MSFSLYFSHLLSNLHIFCGRKNIRAFTAAILVACKKDDEDPIPYEDDFTSRQLPALVSKTRLDVSQVYDPDLGRSITPGENPGANSFPETLWTLVYDLTERKAYYITGREHMEGLDPFVVPMMN